MFGIVNIQKFKEDTLIEDTNYVLIPAAEVPLTNYCDEIMT